MKRLLSVLLAFVLLAVQAIPALAGNRISRSETKERLDPSSTYMKKKDSSAMPSIGSVRFPVILVDFDGYRIEDEEGFREKCEEYFNAEYDPALAKESPFAQSIRGAYQKLSYGRLDLTGDILPIYHSEYPATKYKDRNDGYNLAIEILKTYVETGVLKKENYDSDRDGLVDGVVIKFYLTPELTSEGVSVNKGSAFGDHMSSIRRLEGFSNCTSTVMFEKYPWNQEPRDIWDLDHRNTDAHEIGHMLGLPDHYPTSSYTWIDYSLQDYMTAGCIGYLNIYDKVLLGWVDPIILTSENEITEIELYAAEDYSGAKESKAVVLVPDPLMFPFDEYFILEYRNSSQALSSPYYDEHIYGHSGVVVWHCNAVTNSRLGIAYEDRNRYIYPVYKSGKTRPDDSYTTFNYDSSDLYTAGDIFSSDSTPANSNFYDDVYTGAYLEVESITSEKAVIKAGFRDPDLTPPRP